MGTMLEKKKMVKHKSLHSEVVCLVMCLLLCFSGSGHALEGRFERAIYVFGSSVLDIGNNNYIPGGAKANHVPYGIDYPGGIPTGRFSNGKNAEDFFVELLGVRPPKPSLSINNTINMVEEFLKGVNFASGGAGVLDTTFPGLCMPLSQQIGLFKEMVVATIDKIGLKRTYEHMNRAFILVNIGNNDITAATYNTSTVPEELANLIISHFRPLMKRVHNFGGRTFVIVSVGAQGCLPLFRLPSGECNQFANSLAEAYNKKLLPLMKELQVESYSGYRLRFSYFHLFGAHYKLYKDRKALGFTEGETACCGSGAFNATGGCTTETVPCANRNLNIYWDTSHYTQRFTSLFVKMAYSGSVPYVWPYNVRVLSKIPYLSEYTADDEVDQLITDL